MYTAVSTRTREIATLRALGFNTLSVLISVLAESLGLAAIGGVLGGSWPMWRSTATRRRR